MKIIFLDVDGELTYSNYRNEETADIDIEKVKRMVDLFMEAGFSYFDTAYVYTGSEAATKKAY